ncbi:hypothetical protein [Nocardioides panaciterrulae]|uniref:Lipoprotein n=1 Tax=Nocardioides panaciterrulae TaxID=661492 RepID=A0A7Y9E8Q2_9ACTN|nr:hypothetical protein [Nocardioides panaciterrulae]NYD43173.1 hypothetical protein [Nocardioides panaciterrulae]
MAHRLLAVLLAATLFGLALVLAACSSDNNSTTSPSTTSSAGTASTAPGGTTAVCDSLDALRADVKAMSSAGTLAEFQAGFQDAQKDFADLKPAASAAYGPDVDAVQAALKDFGTALDNAGQGGAGNTLQQLGTAAVQVGTAVQQLVTDVPCGPSSSG